MPIAMVTFIVVGGKWQSVAGQLLASGVRLGRASQARANSHLIGAEAESCMRSLTLLALRVPE